VVLAGADGLDFDLLQRRLHPAESRIRKLSVETPASFVAFDLLALGDEDLRRTALGERRKRLERALSKAGSGVPGAGGTHVLLTPHTDDADEAETWFEAFAPLGLEGVVAKRADLLYRPGDRAMVKVKKIKTADCVVGGYRVAKSGEGIGSLLLGLYDEDGVLHYVGHTSSFKARERREIRQKLRPLEGGESFGWGRSPGGPSRWSAGKDQSFVQLRPELVCEVTFDKLQQGRFRHAATFVRWREDRDPASCTFDQVSNA